MQYVGISGPISSGKSTLANGLAQLYDLHKGNAAVESLATGVKYLAGLYEYHVDRKAIYSNEDKVRHKAYTFFNTLGYSPIVCTQAASMLLEAFDRFPVQRDIKPRELLQYIGTELGRDTIDPYVWIVALKRRLQNNYMTKPDVVFIDDVRFLNESHMVDVLIRIEVDSNKDLYNLRINKPGAVYISLDHPSEQQQLRNPDFILPIDYTLSQVIKLYKQIIEALNSL